MSLMIRTQLYLESRHKRYLMNRAQAKGTTVSEVIRALIHERMARASSTKSKKAMNSGEWALKLARKAKCMGIRGQNLQPRYD